MPTDNTRYLASASIWRSLVHLCLPMIAAFSVGVVHNLINAGFVGTLGSTSLLAALTFALPVLALLIAIGGVFGVGGGTYVTRLLGEQEQGHDTAARIRQVSAFTLWGALAVGAVVAVLGVVFATPIAGLLGASGDALVPTAQYAGAMFAFAPVIVGGFALEQLVRAEGAAVASMTGLIAATLTNLALDAAFILVLDLGVLGAGLALGLANLVQVAFYVWWLSRRSTAVALSPRHLRIDRDLLRTVFGVGAAELVMSSFMIVTGLLFNHLAAAYGEALLAAMGLSLRIVQLPETIAMGVFMGAIPLLAYAFGAGNPARLRAGIRGAAWAIAGTTALFSGLVFVFRDQVFALFSADPAVLEDGLRVLVPMLVSTLFNGFTGLVIAVFQATGQARNALIMSVAQGLLFVPVALVANATLGFTGLIWSMAITETLTFALGLILFRIARAAIGAPSEEARAQALAAAVA